MSLAIRAAVLGAFAVVGLSFVGSWDSRFDLFADFRAPLALGSLALAAAATVIRERFAAGLMFVAFIAGTAPIARLYVHHDRAADGADGPRLRVVLFNTQVENPEKPDVARFLDQSGADLVAVQEATDELSDLIVGTRAFELVVADFRTGIDAKRSSALYRRVDFAARTIESELIRADATQFGMGFLRARFGFDGRDVTVIVPRLPPPVTSARRAMRVGFFDRMVELTKRAREAGDEIVIVADLNTTPFAVDFQRLVDRSGLRDSTVGFGYQPTWPAVGLLRFVKIPIDHLLCSDGLEVIDRRVGEDPHGSDHFPLIVDLAVSGKR